MNEAKRLRELEAENNKLKKLLAEKLRENEAMKDVLLKKWGPESCQALHISMIFTVLGGRRGAVTASESTVNASVSLRKLQIGPTAYLGSDVNNSYPLRGINKFRRFRGKPE